MFCTQSCRSYLIALASFVALSFATEARAKKRSVNHTVAVFLVANGTPSHKLLGALAADLTKPQNSTKIISGKQLRKVLQKKPDAAIVTCGSDIGCIAKLGGKARASFVLYATVASSPGGIQAQFLMVDVASQQLADKVTVEITSVADLTRQMQKLRPRLFMESSSASESETEEIPLDMVLEDPEPQPVVAKQTKLAANSSDDELPLEFALEPGETTVTTEAETTAISALSGDFAPAPVEETPSRSPFFTYIGIGVAGLGVAALGTGCYFSLEAQSKGNEADSAKRGPGGDAQTDVYGLYQESWDATDMSYIFYGVGGGLAALGAGLIMLDLIWLDGGNQPKTSVNVGPNGASASLTWSW
ncbi:MAG: hypothetical protein A2289_05655 [Deltaproteobacteria bacterium RIFOXYA12_FULL_58_15]|nr:MAG: hypothetical protein A2289_05655 [Deltaproteobacteria bacterium RIFOXYA12_FULL_58_15]